MEEAPSKVTGSGALPAAVEDESTATGGLGGVWLGRAVMVVVARLRAPLPSSIRKVALYVPGME